MQKQWMILVVLATAWNVDGFSTKRMNKDWQAAWVYIGSEVSAHFLGRDVGGLVREALSECLAQEGQEDACMKGKRNELCEKIPCKDKCQTLDEIMYGLFSLGSYLHGECKDEDFEDVSDCAEKAITEAGICCNDKPFYGYEYCSDLDFECLFFIDLIGKKYEEFSKGGEEKKPDVTKAIRAIAGKHFKARVWKK